MMLPDDAPAIREMYRVLRPGGVAVIENVHPAAGLALAKRERMELYSGKVILSRKPESAR